MTKTPMEELKDVRWWTLHDEGDYFSTSGPAPNPPVGRLGEANVRVYEAKQVEEILARVIAENDSLEMTCTMRERRIESLEAELADMKRLSDGQSRQYHQVRERNESLEAQLKLAREGLEFYGDEGKWIALRDFEIDLSGFDLGDDEGAKARFIKAQLEKMNAKGDG